MRWSFIDLSMRTFLLFSGSPFTGDSSIFHINLYFLVLMLVSSWEKKLVRVCWSWINSSLVECFSLFHTNLGFHAWNRCHHLWESDLMSGSTIWATISAISFLPAGQCRICMVWIQSTRVFSSVDDKNEPVPDIGISSATFTPFLMCRRRVDPGILCRNQMLPAICLPFYDYFYFLLTFLLVLLSPLWYQFGISVADTNSTTTRFGLALDSIFPLIIVCVLVCVNCLWSL